MIKTISIKSKIYNKEHEFHIAKIWIDEFPNIKCDFDNTFSKTCELNDFIIKKSKRICIEISLLRHASNYALLGLEYMPFNNSLLQVEILYNSKNKDKFISDIGLLNQEYKYCGLLEDYTSGIFEGIEKFYKNNIGCSGKLTFNISANCEVGSSKMIFNKATSILLNILHEDFIHDDRIKELLQE